VCGFQQEKKSDKLWLSVSALLLLRSHYVLIDADHETVWLVLVCADSQKLNGFMRKAQHSDLIFAKKAASAESRSLERDDAAAKDIVQMKLLSLSAFATSSN